MYSVGTRTFPSFHEVVMFANEKGFFFDPELEDMVDGFEERACKELEAMLLSDDIP